MTSCETQADVFKTESLPLCTNGLFFISSLDDGQSRNTEQEEDNREHL